MELNFLCEKRILAKLKQKTTLALMCFVIKISWFFQSSFQIKNLKTRYESHHVCIKDFDRFMFRKTKNENKKKFCKSCFSSKNVLTEQKEVCLIINGAQSVRLEKGTIEFKNYVK